MLLFRSNRRPTVLHNRNLIEAKINNASVQKHTDMFVNPSG
jgi:hypothetical protein